MKKILVAGMSKDAFSERVFSNLKKKNYIIDSFTGFADWNSIHVNKTINGIAAMSPHGLKNSFPDIIPEILDRKTLDYFEHARPYFLRILDRFQVEPISERDAEQYFNDCISYILAYLKNGKSYDLCFSLYAPHSPTGIITYFSCKFLKIPYYFGVRTMIPDIIMFSDNFESISPSFHKFNKEDFEEKRDLNSKSDVNKIFNQTIWLLEASKAINKTGNLYLANKNHSGSILSRLARTKFMIPFVPFLKFILDMLKLILKGDFLRNEFYKLRRLTAIKLIFKNYLLTSSLKKWLKIHSKNKTHHKDYFYFSMHYQPERTTDPESSYFTQQFLAIKLLSTALPEGYHLYVKDHPRQFRDLIDIAKLNFRNIKEYEAINALPNTTFLHPNVNSEDIIKNAKIVSSCTGSALWEALREGIPALSFGFTWHADCKSSPNFSSKENMLYEISNLLKKEKEEVLDDVYNFILDNKSCFIESHFGSIMANESDIDADISADNFSKAIDQIANQQSKQTTISL